jgi:hypothetical protein
MKHWRAPALARHIRAAQVGLLAAAVIVAAAGCTPGSFGAAAAKPSGDAPAVQTYQIRDATHVSTPVQYEQDPPVGGRHAPNWQNCGFYDAPIANELGVHSLEHGAAWLTYRPDLPASQQDALRRLARDPIGKGYVLVTPYPTLPADTPVVASAWGKQMRLQRFDEAALRSFVQTFAVGPQTPEPGAPCSGGVGQPR